VFRFVFFVFLATVATGSADATAEPRSIAVRLDGHPVRGALAHVTQGPDTSRVVPVDGALRVDDGDRIVTIATRDGFASTRPRFPGRSS
jgi:hypothetical protein